VRTGVTYFPAKRDKPDNLGRESRVDDPHLSRVAIASPRRFERLRFDWRSAPAKDTLPRAVWRRGAIIAAVLAVWIAMTVDWGWAAGIAFVFAGAVALLRMAGVILAGPLIQQAGRSYYERQLRGRRRAP